MFLRATGGFYFQSGTTTKAVLTKEGDFGIGTDSPSARLHVAGGNILVDSQYGIRFNDYNTRIYTNSETPEDLLIEADQDLHLDPDGVVKVDTAEFQITSSAAYTTHLNYNNAGSNFISQANGGATQFRNSAGTLMQLNSNGNLSVGAASDTTTRFFVTGAVSDSLAKFQDDVDGVEITTRGSSRQQIDFLGSNTSAINAKGSLFINYDSDNGGSNDTITFTRNGVDEAGTVDMVITEGKVGIANSNPQFELDVSGDVAGTGDGSRITLNGTPYLLSGDSPAETQTLQDVCDNGNTTTTAVNITGALTLANHIFKNVENSFLGLYGGSDTLTNDGFIKIYGDSSNWGKVQTNIGYDATNSKAHWTLNNTTDLMTLKGDGYLGIGISSPDAKLHIKDSTDPPEIRLEDAAGGTQTAKIVYDQAGQNSLVLSTQYQSSSDENLIQFAPADSVAMTIRGGTSSKNGYVGIGTTAPAVPLHVTGNTEEIARFESSDNEVYISLKDNTDSIYVGLDPTRDVMSLGFDIPNDSTTNLSIDTAGNVGIGTNNPTELLEVDGNIRLGDGGARDIIGPTNESLRILSNPNASDEGIVFSTDAGTTTGMFLQDGNNVGIGTISPDELLRVVGGNICVTNGQYFIFDGAGSKNHKMRSYYDGSQGHIEIVVAGNDIVDMAADGKVGIGTNTALGTLHVYTADAGGAIATNASHDDLIIENNGNCGIQFSSPASSYQYVAFGDTASANQGYVRYYHGDDSMTLRAGGSDTMILKGGNVGIGSAPTNKLDVFGHFSATSKSFLIDHPTKENKKLQYGSLEGPENGVYVRGTTDKETIELPEYWSELVHDESITVVLTPIGKKQDLFIIKKSNKLIKIGGAEGSFDYVVYGERKDIDRLEIEPDGN
jgi:hypothetical protein